MTKLPANLRPATLEEALGVIEQLLRIIAEQQAQIATLQARVTELEAAPGTELAELVAAAVVRLPRRGPTCRTAALGPPARRATRT